MAGHLRLLAAATLVGAAKGCSDPVALPFEVVAGTRQLFLDQAGVASSQNVAQTMHTPRKKGAVVRPRLLDADANRHDLSTYVSCQVRNAPLWVPEERQFRFLVLNCDPDAANNKQWFTSPDGIQWTREKAITGELKPGYMVVYEPNSTHPYKTIDGSVGGIQSADGLSWNETHSALGIERGDEANLSYDPVSGRYIYTMKRFSAAHPGRAVAVATSTDFFAKNWSDFGITFGSDALDQAQGKERIRQLLADPDMPKPFCAFSPPGKDGACYPESKWNIDVYNMGVFRYESVYIGLPTFYHAVGQDGANTDGFQAVQLVSTRDLRTWNRLGNRSWFLGPSKAGSGAYDLLELLGPSNVIVANDTLLMYYTGIKTRAPDQAPDWAPLEMDQGAICLASLRRDGWVSLGPAAPNSTATVTTKTFTAPKGTLYINADASRSGVGACIGCAPGAVLVTALVGGKRVPAAPLGGDMLATAVAWPSPAPALAGETVALEFKVTNAALYSYWFAYCSSGLVFNKK